MIQQAMSQRIGVALRNGKEKQQLQHLMRLILIDAAAYKLLFHAPAVVFVRVYLLLFRHTAHLSFVFSKYNKFKCI